MQRGCEQQNRGWQQYDESWVRAALHGSPGAGPAVTRQVAEATGVRDVGLHVEALEAWAAINPGAENNPDYWREYKQFAIASLTTHARR